MTQVSTDAAGQQPSYELNYELDGSSFAVRENLADILERELLGPIDGPEETLQFSPRTQYLVGHIAPVKLTGSDISAPEDDDDDGELVEIRTDEGGVSGGRGVPAHAADDTDADAEDDDSEDRTPKQGLMIPASMGLRFQVPADLEAFRVIASWGTYETIQTDEIGKNGRPVRVYQRTPIEETRSIRLSDLIAGQTSTVVLKESIVLRIDRYDDHKYGRVLVELALCNDRETPMPIPLNMWMFQTKLLVDAGGAEVFLPVQDVLVQDWPEHDD